MAIRKVKKKEHGMTLNRSDIPITRMDRESGSGLSKKLQAAETEIEKLKTRLSEIEERLDALEQ